MSQPHFRRLALAAPALAALVVACPAPAIDITIQYDSTQTGAVSPAFDASGARLTAIANYAASFYENVFEDAGHSLALTIWYSDLPDNQLGNHDNITDDVNSREATGTIRFDTQSVSAVARNYFFDPSPSGNSEFTMNQTFWRDLTGGQQIDFYNDGGSVPATFETAFTGTAPALSPAAGTIDMLSLVFHEIGHSLGMSGGIPLTVTETNDGDYDFVPAWVFGAALAADNVDQATDFVGHLDDPASLMAPSLAIPGSNGSAGVRKLPSHSDLFSMAAGSDYTLLDVPRREFYNANGNWNTDGNWSGDNTPSNANDTFVRNGNTATLSAFGAAGNLSVLEGALVSTQANTLFVQNTTTVAGTIGDESQITINTGGQLDSDNLLINSGGRVVLVSTALLESENINIAAGGELRGFGTVSINSIIGELVSDGMIRATNNSELVITSLNNVALSLGGTVEAVSGNVRFETGMFEGISGDVVVGAGREVIFNAGGSIAAGGLLLLNGTSGSPATASGTTLSVGQNGVIIADGVGVVENTLILQAQSIVSTELDPNSEIRLDGTTFFRGGRVVGDGRARQNGNAFVEQNTEISIDTYDMDGIAGGTSITISPSRTLEITSPHLETTADNDFDGTFTINSGTLDITAAWRLDGTLNLNQTTAAVPTLTGAGGVTVANGAEINVSGAAALNTTLAVDNGSIFVDGNAIFSGTTTLGVNADIEINNDGDSLRLRGTTNLIGPSIVGSGRVIFEDDVNVAFVNTFIGAAETDLDGVLGDTQVVINSGITFGISSTTLEPTANDGFDGSILNRGTFSVLAGWRLDGELDMVQLGGTVPTLAGVGAFRIHTTGTFSTDGDAAVNPPLQVAGAMTIDGGVTRVNNTAAFESTANVAVDTGAELELNGVTTFAGGAYTGAGLIQFNGATTINSSTTFNVARVDLDGAAENTHVSIVNSALVLNVTGLDTLNNLVGGTIDVSGLTSRLEVNLANPQTAWRHVAGGTLNFANPTPVVATQLEGSDLSAEGTINVDGLVRFGANVSLRGALQTNDVGTDVYFSGGGQNLIFSTAVVAGPGSMTIDGAPTRMYLQDGVNIGIDVENDARLEVGFVAIQGGFDVDEPGAAQIVGDFRQTSDAVLEIELGGLAAGDQFDVLNITAAAHLAGILEIEFLDLFTPVAGNAFQILTFLSRTGDFGDLVGDYLGEGLFLDPVYDSDSLTLVTTQASPGDTDLDGDVDLADLGNLATSFGLNNPNIDWMNGDFDGDNDVDLNDLGTLASNFEGGRAAAYVEFQSLVPEPNSLAFIGVSMLMLKRQHRRQICR